MALPPEIPQIKLAQAAVLAEEAQTLPQGVAELRVKETVADFLRVWLGVTLTVAVAVAVEPGPLVQILLRQAMAVMAASDCNHLSQGPLSITQVAVAADTMSILAHQSLPVVTAVVVTAVATLTQQQVRQTPVVAVAVERHLIRAFRRLEPVQAVERAL